MTKVQGHGQMDWASSSRCRSTHRSAHNILSTYSHDRGDRDDHGGDDDDGGDDDEDVDVDDDSRDGSKGIRGSSEGREQG